MEGSSKIPRRILGARNVINHLAAKAVDRSSLTKALERLGVDNCEVLADLPLVNNRSELSDAFERMIKERIIPDDPDMTALLSMTQYKGAFLVTSTLARNWSGPGGPGSRHRPQHSAVNENLYHCWPTPFRHFNYFKFR